MPEQLPLFEDLDAPPAPVPPLPPVPIPEAMGEELVQLFAQVLARVLGQEPPR